MKALHLIAFILLVVGGLNWGLVGLFDWNLVEAIFGSVDWLERLVYILVGLSALYLLVTHRADCRTCAGESNRAAAM